MDGSGCHASPLCESVMVVVFVDLQVSRYATSVSDFSSGYHHIFLPTYKLSGLSKSARKLSTLRLP